MICDPGKPPHRASHGFSLPTAIFLLVVLWLLGAFVISITGTQRGALVMDVRGARAYQAARAGIEWAAYHVLDPNNDLQDNSPPVNLLAPCPGAAGSSPSTTTLPALAGSLADFTVTVACTATDATEANRVIRVFRITATAASGAPGTADYIERKLEAVLSKCKNPAAPAPRFACGG
ncbi:MAG: hypothetical protein ACK4N4_00675 [Burkholderiales bacterium]